MTTDAAGLDGAACTAAVKAVRWASDEEWRDRPTIIARILTADSRAWQYCPCGHLWLVHDIEEYDGDGSDTCCAEGCDQVGCPGKTKTAPDD